MKKFILFTFIAAFLTVSFTSCRDQKTQEETLIEEMVDEGAEVKIKDDGDKIKMKTEDKKVKIKTDEDGDKKIKIKEEN